MKTTCTSEIGLVRCTLFLLAPFFIIALAAMAEAQDFSTRNMWQRTPPPYATVTHPPVIAPSTGPSAWNAPWSGPRQATYRVERDPRYLSSIQQTSYLTPAVTTAYRGAGDCVPGNCQPGGQVAYGSRPYGGHVRSACSAASVPPPVAYYPPQNLTNVMPRGHYRGDGLYGQDTVYAQGEPVRNFFRFLVP